MTLPYNWSFGDFLSPGPQRLLVIADAIETVLAAVAQLRRLGCTAIYDFNRNRPVSRQIREAVKDGATAIVRAGAPFTEGGVVRVEDVPSGRKMSMSLDTLAQEAHRAQA